MILHVILSSKMGGELDRKRLELPDDEDSAEVSVAIFEAMEDWVLSPGDIISIEEEGVVAVSLDDPAAMHNTIAGALGEPPA